MSKLAKKIATRIMTMQGVVNTKVDRIQFMKKDAQGVEVNVGGRNFDSLVREIDEVLQEE